MRAFHFLILVCIPLLISACGGMAFSFSNQRDAVDSRADPETAAVTHYGITRTTQSGGPGTTYWLQSVSGGGEPARHELYLRGATWEHVDLSSVSGPDGEALATREVESVLVQDVDDTEAYQFSMIVVIPAGLLETHRSSGFQVRIGGNDGVGITVDAEMIQAQLDAVGGGGGVMTWAGGARG